MAEATNLEYASQCEIINLKILSTTGLLVDLDDYMVEMNIYEDIWKNFVHGDILISDSRNLISLLPIIGEEFLIVELKTPTLDMSIKKVFRIFSVKNRETLRDNNTQIYLLEFCSHEAMLDVLTPLYRPFEGKISNVVEKIYQDFLQVPRDLKFENKTLIDNEEDQTPLVILNETANSVKFISPGWSASKCINWLCSKSIPAEGAACNFLFWESTQAFYFGSIEKRIDDFLKSEIVRGVYYYYPPNLNAPAEVSKKLFIAQDFSINNTVDNIANNKNGYLANRLITLDLIDKKYEVTDYDYVDKYSVYKHLSGENSVPLFAQNTLRNPAAHTKFYPSYPKLFTGFKENVNEKMKDIYGNRLSLLNEINNFSINITVPGRTDMEAGCLIQFIYPEVGSMDNSSDAAADTKYSGIYLVSAVRHKFTTRSHIMLMELVKDSLSNKKKDAS